MTRASYSATPLLRLARSSPTRRYTGWYFPGLLHENNSFNLCRYRLFSYLCISKLISALYLTNFVKVRHLTEPAPSMYRAGSVTYGGTFCQWWYSFCDHRMSSRTSLADRKNILFIVVINYEENNSQIWSRHSIFLLSTRNGIRYASSADIIATARRH